MPLEPHDPPRPGRLIVPGGDPVEPEVEGADPAPPKIVLPPGVRSETEEDDLPEYPRLRPLEVLPVHEGGRDFLLVTDPLGVMPAPVALKLEALDLLRVLDGTVSLNDLAAEVVRGSKDLRAAALVKDFVAQLDRLLMLESPRFEKAFLTLRDQYHQLEIRQALLAGLSYPQERSALDPFLDGHFAEAEKLRAGTRATTAHSGTRPRALVAPHLDPRRAGAVIARAYLELDADARSPLRVVVFGTGHSLHGDLFALTRKHFETPYGKLECDTRFVDRVAQSVGDKAYLGELAHRTEHSIEFQALYLERRFGDRPLTLVPILCGGFHQLLADGRTPREDASIEALIAGVRNAEKALGGDTVYVAGVDLSHVGPRFGDPGTDERTAKEVEEKDRAALEAARKGDAEAWYQVIAAHEDSTRICGWAPTYMMLRCAEPGEGRILHYEQSSEQDGSMVTVGAMSWP